MMASGFYGQYGYCFEGKISDNSQPLIVTTNIGLRTKIGFELLQIFFKTIPIYTIVVIQWYTSV